MLLLALKVWVLIFKRAKIVIINDASGVLVSIVRMRARARSVNEVCKETALVLAPFGYHLEGIHVYSEHNVLADTISRASSQAELPRAVANARREVVDRSPAQWRILGRDAA